MQKCYQHSVDPWKPTHYKQSEHTTYYTQCSLTQYNPIIPASPRSWYGMYTWDKVYSSIWMTNTNTELISSWEATDSSWLIEGCIHISSQSLSLFLHQYLLILRVQKGTSEFLTQNLSFRDHSLQATMLLFLLMKDGNIYLAIFKISNYGARSIAKQVESSL